VIYHLLDEQEVFSERDGGAISRWTANVLREGSEIVVCPSYDSTWNFPSHRIYQLANWSRTDFPVHPVLYRSPWIIQKWIYTLVFRELMRKVKDGDVIYVHNRPECASVLATIAPRRGVRIVLHMHNSHLLRANRGQLNSLREVPIIFCSKFLRDEVEAAMPNYFKSTQVVYNGADGAKFRIGETDKEPIPTVIFTGRLVPYKGVHVLLDAMRILEKKNIAVQCKVVGAAGFGRSKSTRYTQQLQRLCPRNTELVGYRTGDALAALLRQSDIFCCPSIWNDPFPLAPLEAMATGLPIVATNVGGLPEALAHGGGLLVAPNDAAALADALEVLLTDTSRRQELGAEAYRAFRNHFVWNCVRSQYQTALRSVMA